eukprot:g11948.t1
MMKDRRDPRWKLCYQNHRCGGKPSACESTGGTCFSPIYYNYWKQAEEARVPVDDRRNWVQKHMYSDRRTLEQVACDKACYAKALNEEMKDPDPEKKKRRDELFKSNAIAYVKDVLKATDFTNYGTNRINLQKSRNDLKNLIKIRKTRRLRPRMRRFVPRISVRKDHIGERISRTMALSQCPNKPKYQCKDGFRCPCKNDILAVPKSERWKRFDLKHCRTSCKINMGNEGPHCLKKISCTAVEPQREHPRPRPSCTIRDRKTVCKKTIKSWKKCRDLAKQRDVKFLGTYLNTENPNSHPKGCWHYPGPHLGGPGFIFSEEGSSTLTDWSDTMVCRKCESSRRRRRILGMVKNLSRAWDKFKQNIKQFGVSSECKDILKDVEMTNEGVFEYDVQEDNRIGICIKHVFKRGKQESFEASGAVLTLFKDFSGKKKVRYNLVLNGQDVAEDVNDGRERMRRRLLKHARGGGC